ncbi:MAG: type II secretion system protein [Myxococcales bacterium]|nr:prepilin-type N-terminal cleavage/methylation domain-containing protein [Polyangiaceae bacterium]MDW8247868.1 type II secretion system protein [Myxococcales bacterium]
MISPRLRQARGFTLVELMIVVAIIGVLAALAVFGVRKYLASAKSAEARNNIGSINRAAVTAYERELMPSELVPGGDTSAQVTHNLCDSSIPVPSSGTPPPGKKYQPSTKQGSDYATGNATTGWRCLQFGIEEPHYYAYKYTRGGNFELTTNLPVLPGMAWAAEAKGDLNGDGFVFSEFAGIGGIEGGFAKIATTLLEANPDE